MYIRCAKMEQALGIRPGLREEEDQKNSTRTSAALASSSCTLPLFSSSLSPVLIPKTESNKVSELVERKTWQSKEHQCTVWRHWFVTWQGNALNA